MSKKNTKSGSKLTSIKGGKGTGGYGVGDGTGHETVSTTDDTATPNGNVLSTEPGSTVFGPTKVIDFSSVRAQRNLDNRRTFERFFLEHMIDVYCELDGGKQQLPVEVVEVSESGCSFRLSTEKSKALPRDTTGAIMPLHVRFYFSRDSYLRVGLFVVNSNCEITSAGNSVRFGCRVDETFASTEAYRQFVRFMEQFARHAHRNSKQVSSY